MYSLGQMRRRVDVLLRKYADTLAIIDIRPRAQDYADRWTTAIDNEETPPDPMPLIDTVIADKVAGDWKRLYDYLSKCRKGERFPEPSDMLEALFPRAKAAVYAVMRWDPPVPPEYRLPDLDVLYPSVGGAPPKSLALSS